MKQVIFLVVMWWPVMGWGQVVDGVDLGKMENLKYMEVVVTKTPFTKSYFAKADIGQGLKVGEHGFEEDGKDKDFKSEIHVLNWLWNQGWDLVRDWQEGEVRHFLMEKAPPENK